MHRRSDWWWEWGFGPGFKPHGHGRKRSRRMRWRMFERGDLKFVILRLIADKPMHGYEVMRALEEESQGMYRASPGSVYPTLQMLEDEGYLGSDESSGKKVYHITDEGEAYLERNRDVVDDVLDRVSDFTDRFFGEGMRDLSASFSRLAQMTFETAMRSGSDRETLADMNEVLEEAIRGMRRAGRGAEDPGDGGPGKDDPSGARASGNPEGSET